MEKPDVLGDGRKALLTRDFDRLLAAYKLFKSRAVDMGVANGFWVKDGIKQDELVNLFKTWYANRGVLIYSDIGHQQQQNQKSRLIL